MVSFTRGRTNQREHLIVRSLISYDGGCRLIVTLPDGLQQLRYFANDSALFDGTMALQAELLANGWEPVRACTARNEFRPIKPTDDGRVVGR